MGRRAKYLSLEEKALAQREHDLNYSRSVHGKPMRSAYREYAHRRKQRKIPQATPLLPSPTPRQLRLYLSPLPTHSPLFAEALRSPDALDESDLARWKKEPPFEKDDDPTDPHSSQYLKFTRSLIEVLHGVRLREENQRDAQLRKELQGGGRKHVLLQLEEEVLEKCGVWRRVEELEKGGFYHPDHQSREFAMLEHYLQWLGRSICYLYYLKFAVL
ncbi:hypothetical protein R3P38DRAFT_3170405 [Favolaschia claudopus]|uniref:Uncharacterized protein n=1 Tax=Favolaschia claudopus TaxID=2862362 RepID=A0AAW0DW88_9AGAR